MRSKKRATLNTYLQDAKSQVITINDRGEGKKEFMMEEVAAYIILT